LEVPLIVHTEGREVERVVSCDEAVRRIGARHGSEIEALWREDLAQRRARVAATKLRRQRWQERKKGDANGNIRL
jgi:hypothetical protein